MFTSKSRPMRVSNKFLSLVMLTACMFHSLFAEDGISEDDYLSWQMNNEQACEDSGCYPQDCSCCSTCCLPNIISIGPEVYYVKRKRSGGTHQHGTCIGARATYDHIKRYRIYWGGQAFYGTGILKGRTGSGAKIRSRFTDEQIEGALGYTFQGKEAPHLSITPYGGYGYFREKNKFMHPSPLHVSYITQFRYFAFGFLSSAMINPCFKVGINARFRYLWNARCKITGDPEFCKVDQQVGDKIHYRIEVPIIYCRPICWPGFELGVVPFYENRWYGGRENFPFDFFETKLKIYGVNLQLIYQF